MRINFQNNYSYFLSIKIITVLLLVITYAFANIKDTGDDASLKKPTGENKRATKFLSGFEKETEGVDNHEMSRGELEDYLKNELGSEHFDDDSEVTVGVNQAFENVDVGGDGTISLTELTSSWDKLNDLKTVDDVADWIKYSVLLPQYEDNFRNNAITGYDLPSLLEGKGDVLNTDLGIKNKLHRKIILRSITTRLLGIGKIPPPINNMYCYLLPNCNGIEIDWDVEANHDEDDDNEEGSLAVVESIMQDAEATSQEQIPVHLYRIKRLMIENAPKGMKSKMKKRLNHKTFVDKDQTCKKLPFFDENANVPGMIYRYKMQSWNLFGASKWTKHINCPPIPLKCKEIIEKKKASDQKRVTNFMNKIEWTTEGSNDLEIRREELNEFIRESLGKSENFDEDKEISNSVDNAFDTMDLGGDGVISHAELEAFWEKMDGLQTIDEIADWVKYGLQLKQYEDNFRSNSITGDILPTLLTKKHFLKNVLEITNELHILQFRRSLKARLLGLHKIPNIVKMHYCKSHCDRFEVFWTLNDDYSNSDNNKMLKPHSYQLQERLSRINIWNDFVISSHNDRSFSSTKYVGEEKGGIIEFRIRSWSSFGTSEWSEVTTCPPRPLSCERNAEDNLNEKKDEKIGNTSTFYKTIDNILNFFNALKDAVVWLYVVCVAGTTIYYLYTKPEGRKMVIDMLKRSAKTLQLVAPTTESGQDLANADQLDDSNPNDNQPEIRIETVTSINNNNSTTTNNKNSSRRCQIAGCTKSQLYFSFNRCIGLKGTFYRPYGGKNGNEQDCYRKCQKYFCKLHTGCKTYPHFICSECYNIGIKLWMKQSDESKIDPNFVKEIKKIRDDRRNDRR